MSIKTGKVQKRRKLHFNSLTDLLTEAERLAAAPALKTLGNWSAGQIFSHLARAMDMSISGSSYRSPWYLRMAAKLIKRRMLTRTMPAGFKLPGPMQKILIASDSIRLEEGLQELRSAVKQLEQETVSQFHPVFGKLTDQEWKQLHLRHAEMHLSFLEIDA